MSGIPVVTDEDGVQSLAGPIFEFDYINVNKNETRFLILLPCGGDKGAPENHVRCSLEVQPLTEADPFVAVKNGRGYRLMQLPIEINGKYLLVSIALERFLRHYRKSDVPVRLWLRYLCVNDKDAAEMSSQWTRPWVDKMYELAESIVDMQPFLRDLQDRGVFEHAVDARYMDWTKEWEEPPESGPLPKIFPVRLGAKPAPENPTANYEYVPLDTVADETRIAVISNNPDREAPLSIYLAHCPVVCEVAYHALSHTWGLDHESCDIIVTGQKWQMRRNLEVVLRYLRSPTHGFAIWVDTLCIDQSDLSERNHQIDRIARIFDRAACVICYVGDSDQYSDLALDFVKHLHSLPVVPCDENGNWKVGQPERISVSKLPEYCAALYLFLKRPYFRRAWIIQEIALASSPVIVCGDRHDVSLRLLDQATHNLFYMISQDAELCENMMKSAPEIGEVDIDELYFVRKLFYFRHLHTGGALYGWKRAEVSATSPGYLETLILARNFQATIPHDKIFALWNVANDKKGLEFAMDYSVPFDQTCMNFVKAWCAQTGSLDIIGAAEFARPSDTNLNNFYATASSWCPDWSVSSQASSFIRRETFRMESMDWMDDIDGTIYWADGGVHQEPGTDKFFTFEGRTLYCTGLILDHVMASLPRNPNDSSVAAKVGGLLGANKHFEAEGKKTPYEDAEQAVMAMMHGDVVAAWPRREDNMENADEDLPMESYVCTPRRPRACQERLPSESRHVPYYAGGYRRSEAYHVARTILRGRIPFITAKYYLGLMPEYAVAADGETRTLVVAILATCSVPVLLEEHPKVPGAYRLVGTCFVQGWMEGEVLCEEMGCDDPAEFWNALEGSERLRIL
ncbi:hypothetical protein LTR84_001231 [Exophiala bonariae]|uniref:Heterokaryon incompatibility domain-containing protein n=1 Tax=Exophiala bonariae TaxID=1690606 RepID=A0AAV9NWH8_9EURO|nr:hypothetical protein LTR84_001231 [Exophiala bonariae]